MDSTQLNKRKSRGRHEITLIEVVKKETSIKEAAKSMTSDGIKWQKKIYVISRN